MKIDPSTRLQEHMQSTSVDIVLLVKDGLQIIFRDTSNLTIIPTFVPPCGRPAISAKLVKNVTNKVEEILI